MHRMRRATRMRVFRFEDRVADLLPRMTLEEKVEQTQLGWENKLEVIDPTGTYTSETARKIILKTWGAETPIYAATVGDFAQCGAAVSAREDAAGNSRDFLGEATARTTWSMAAQAFRRRWGLASTWDPALVKRVFTAVGDEAGSRGVGQVFSPVLDIARDPRWGRTEETYGEDPYLVSRMGVAAIEGPAGRFVHDRTPSCAGDCEAFCGTRTAGGRHKHRSGKHLRADHSRELSGSL